MKKLLFIFVIAMPSLIVGMENGAIKLYSVERLKQGYQELFPVSDGSLNKGWGSPYGGITLARPAYAGIALSLMIFPPFADAFVKNVDFPNEYYQPKITDITVANLLVYCQKHEEQTGQLQQRLVVINNSVNQQRILEDQIDQLKRDQDTEDHQFTEDTVLGRRRNRIAALHINIERAYNLRTADITALRENFRDRDRIMWQHEQDMNQLEQGIHGYHTDAERHRANIIILQRNRNNHSGNIDRHARQIAQLQQDVRDHVRATDDKYENEINQFVRKKLQETLSNNEQDSSRNTHIKQLLEDVAILKKTLHQWIPHTAKNSIEMGYENKEKESTTSSCSTTDAIALKKY